jgi:hypothetical protein
VAEDLKPAINLKYESGESADRSIGKPGNFGFAELKEIFGPLAASNVAEAFSKMGSKQQVVADLMPVVLNGRGWS